MLLLSDVLEVIYSIIFNLVQTKFWTSDNCLYCIKLGPNIKYETCSGSTCIEAEVYGKPDSQGSSTEKFNYHRSHITARLDLSNLSQYDYL